MKNIRGVIVGVIFISVSLLLLIAIIGFWGVRPLDWRMALSANNPIGPVGSYLATFFIHTLGIGSIFIPFMIFLGAISLIREKALSYFKIISFVILILAMSILFSPLNNPTREFSLFNGGLLGFNISFFLLHWLHLTGSYIVIISILLITSLYLGGEAILSIRLPSPKIKKEPSSHPEKKKKGEKPKIVLSSERKETTIEKEEIKEQAYQLPPLSLLNDPVIIPEKEIKEDLLTLSKQLEETLLQFKIDAKVICINRGPTVTSFEVQPSPGVRVSSISGLSNDIALALAAQAVRIEAPIPGKQAIGIETPNHKMQPVFLKEGLASNEFKKKDSLLSFFLGKDITGTPIIVDLTSMPHLLVAGVTGSGKSVCLASIITSFLYKASPCQLRLVLIDPKRVEMTVFSELPHLLTPVICDSKKAIITLHWLLKEMDERYKVFAAEGVRDIAGYHKKIGELPYIVVVIDELADLIAVSLRSCEETLTRLSQMARAVGIHLIIATQRPSVDIITGLIKANFPSRIAFQVFSRVDSRTILDMMGAEKLLGRGDMLFFPAGTPKPVRLQGAYISISEIEEITSFIKSQGIILPKEEIKAEEIKELGEDEEIDDDIYEKAVSLVEMVGYGSTSMIQRKLKIGYNRAASLIERMEEEGIVGPPDGSKPRKVLLER